MRKNISVYADWEGLHKPTLIGVLHADLLRGNEIFSFEYDSNWLQSGHTQLLDPDLQLYAGVQYLNDQEKTNFGLFL
ncbi:MAG: type II toxin-antitoxin system HipA family toxin, partial [Fulvivirga sp.]